MNDLSIYIFQANVVLATFGVLYWLLSRKETNFKFLRFYILISAALAAIIPLLRNQIAFTNTNFGQGMEAFTQTLPVLGFSSGQEVAHNYFSFTNMAYLYAIGVLFMAILLVTKYIRVFRFVRSNSMAIVNKEGYRIILTNGKWPTFTFFKYLFFDDSGNLSALEKEQIIAHEKAHIFQKHSWDIVFLEIVKAIFWINPIAWFYTHSIKNVHEYLADETAVTTTGATKAQYTQLLAQMAISNLALSVGHHFNKQQTLNRINMMTTTKNNTSAWKPMLFGFTIMAMAIIIGCEQQYSDDATAETDEIIEIPASEIFTKVETPTKPVDGMDVFFNEIANNLKYPEQARKAGVEGTVFVEFIVTKTGDTIDHKVLKGIGAGCDEAALNVVKSSKMKWTAPMHGGKKVNQKIVLPINFSLQ